METSDCSPWTIAAQSNMFASNKAIFSPVGSKRSSNSVLFVGNLIFLCSETGWGQAWFSCEIILSGVDGIGKLLKVD